MVTASHNPKQYNGFKLCFGDVLPIGAESGMNDIQELVLAGPYPGRPEGTVVETSIREAYLKKLFSLIDVGKFRKLNVVVDTGNGMEGIIVEDIFRRLPSCKFSGLFLELDGSFPNHEANPLKTETLEALQKKVHALKADIGVAYDGDADRIGLTDEDGVPVRGDILLALLAPRLLARSPGAAIIYDVRCSMIVPEQIDMAGGRPVMWKVGHGLIKPKMRLEDAVFAGELSQHYYFRDLHNAENTDLVMLMVFELMSETGKKLSELVAPLMCYHHSGEINFQVADKAAVLAKLEEVYGHEASAVAKIDGLRLDFRNEAAPEEDWWFSVRASNTEPLLRLNLEAKSKEKMEAKKQELVGLINA
jgi:phosphomannomutase